MKRYRVVPDDDWDMENMKGDMFNPDCVDHISPEQLAEEEKEYEEMLARDGVWGCVVEEKCDHCGVWSDTDSCWGFDTHDSAEEFGKDMIAE